MIIINKRICFIWGLLICLILFFSMMSPGFLHHTNLLSLLQNSMEIAIIAIGMTVVMILGGVDMSVGALLGVLAILSGWMIQAGMPSGIIIMLIILIGFIIGISNGYLITVGNIPDMIVTIAVMYILKAMIFIMLNGQWLTGIPDILGSISKDSFLYIPYLFWILLILYTIALFILSYTKAGRRIYAVGSNEIAAQIVGINISKVKILSYGLVGGLTGLASLLYISRLGSVEITIGSELHIQVIAAVVIGGTSVLGGSGSVVGTLAGVFIMAVLRNGINLMGIPSLMERVLVGFFLLLSVLLDLMLKKKK